MGNINSNIKKKNKIADKLKHFLGIRLEKYALIHFKLVQQIIYKYYKYNLQFLIIKRIQ